MLWSIDTCQNKVSADLYHVTISRARVGPYRGQLFLTAGQGLVIGSQAQGLPKICLFSFKTLAIQEKLIA